jgi:hypothetical protein
MVKVSRISAPVGAGVSSKQGGKAIKNDLQDVASIQTMLKAIPSDQGGSPNIVVTGTLQLGNVDQTTVAIRKFQQKKFGFQDGVVDPGGRTEDALQALAGGKDDVQPDVKPTGLPLDIIVRFTGGPGGNRRDTEREKQLRQGFNTDAYQKTHQPLAAICFVGFREQESFVGGAVADVVRLRADAKQGVTIVIGSSAGGVSALKAARDLTAKSIHLDYVGINDAAFLSSKNEVTFQPAFAINLNAAIGGEAIKADLTENFFQTIGHGFQADKASPTGFFPHAEFHGPLTGFQQNVDLKDKPRVVAVKTAFGAAQGASPFTLPVAVRDRFAAAIHKQAGGTAENLIAPRITQLVKP